MKTLLILLAIACVVLVVEPKAVDERNCKGSATPLPLVGVRESKKLTNIELLQVFQISNFFRASDSRLVP